MNTFHLRIVKPEKVVFETEAISFSFPTSLGETTILAHHEPMVMQAAIGEMIVRTKNEKGEEKKELIAIAGGTIEVGHNEVLVLANRAEHVRELDIARAKEARDRVATEIEKLGSEHSSYEGLLQKLHKETNRVHLAEKWRAK